MDSPNLYLCVLMAMGGASVLLLTAFPPIRVLAARDPGRYGSLDAFRGLLALSVLAHHAYIAYFTLRGGDWQAPTSNAYNFAGGGSVALFFMITGLLFWGKVIDGNLKFGALIRSRLLRIMPLYLFSCAVIFAVCMVQSGFRLQVEPDALVLSVTRWLAGGLLGSPSINGVFMPMVNGGVTWTLQFEWIFYLVLPLLVIVSSRRRFAWFVAAYLAVLAVACAVGQERASAALFKGLPFLGGMFAAYVVRGIRAPAAVRGRAASCFVVLSIATVAAFYSVESGPRIALALTPAFVLIALGNDVFGLLGTLWLRWLGKISFSVYLLHGIVLLVGLKLLDARWPIVSWDVSLYLTVCAVIAVLVVLTCSLTYLFIERRFLGGMPWRSAAAREGWPPVGRTVRG